MLDEGGCGYNNFEYVSGARLKGVNNQYQNCQYHPPLPISVVI